MVLHPSYTNIALMLVRLPFKLKHLLAFVAISKVKTLRLPPCCFGRLFTAFLTLAGFGQYFFTFYPGIPLMVFSLEAVELIKNL